MSKIPNYSFNISVVPQLIASMPCRTEAVIQAKELIAPMPCRTEAKELIAPMPCRTEAVIQAEELMAPMPCRIIQAEELMAPMPCRTEAKELMQGWQVSENDKRESSFLTVTLKSVTFGSRFFKCELIKKEANKCYTALQQV